MARAYLVAGMLWLASGTDEHHWIARGNEEWKQALASDPMTGQLHAEESLKCFSKALELNPANIQARLGRDRLSYAEASATTADLISSEITQEIADAVKTLHRALSSMKPVRRTGMHSEFSPGSKFGLSKSEFGLWSAIRTVAVDYGGLRSQKSGFPEDAAGRPLPLYSYPMIEWLDQLNLSKRTVLEYGAGHSTLFYARHAQQVVSVESDLKWTAKLRKRANRAGFQNIDIIDASSGSGAALDLSKWKTSKFDIIVIDGSFNRFEMAKDAFNRLSEIGLVLLDNTEAYPSTADMLRSHGMMQIDFHGLRPSELTAGTTSVFFSAGARGGSGFRDPWSRFLRQHLDRQAFNGSTEWERLSAPSGHISKLAAGYAVGGNYHTVISGWDYSEDQLAAGHAGIIISSQTSAGSRRRKQRD